MDTADRLFISSFVTFIGLFVMNNPALESSLEITTDVMTAINNLHKVAEEMSQTSMRAAPEAIIAAWKAGKLLCGERERIRSVYGHGKWESWLRNHFLGSVSTAKRYMRLFKSVTDVTDLKAMNLRKAYQLLGILPAASNSTDANAQLEVVEPHLMWAQKLMAFLRRESSRCKSDKVRLGLLRQDMAPLFEELRKLNLSNSGG